MLSAYPRESVIGRTFQVSKEERTARNPTSGLNYKEDITNRGDTEEMLGMV